MQDTASQCKLLTKKHKIMNETDDLNRNASLKLYILWPLLRNKLQEKTIRPLDGWVGGWNEVGVYPSLQKVMSYQYETAAEAGIFFKIFLFLSSLPRNLFIGTFYVQLYTHR